jgi:pyruvoyl-dependent arginine decarboxylase (PvlArgDC)
LLTSREPAPTDAGVEKVTLIKASGIIPPGCEIVSAAEGRELLTIGQIALAITAECSTDDPEKNLDPEKGLYRIKGKSVRVSHMTRTTFGDKGGRHTTVFVAAVFLFQ